MIKQIYSKYYVKTYDIILYSYDILSFLTIY